MKGRGKGAMAKQLHGGDEPPGAKEGGGGEHEGDMDNVKLNKGGAAKKHHKAKGEKKEKKRRDRRARGGGVESNPISTAGHVSGNPKQVKTDKSDD